MTLFKRRAAVPGLAAALAISAAVLALPRAFSAPNPDNKSTPASQDAAPVNRSLTRGQYVAREALSFRGLPYRFGGTSSRGFDCSGLTQAVMAKYGIYLPRTSVEQFKQGTPVHFADLQPGDLVFFKNTYKKGISHVAIYIGDGKILHAANEKKGVIVTRLDAPYFAHRLAGARRLPLDTLPEATASAE